VTIELFLFGPFQAVVDGVEITSFRSDKARAMLAYVAAQPDRAHSRDALATLLWGEQDDASAKTNLRNVISNLRKVLNSAETDPALDVTRQAVQLQSHIAVDSVQFETLLDATKTHSHQRLDECADCIANLKQAIDLYRGDFLAHLYVADAPAFDDWSAAMRENLHQRAVDSLRLIAEYHTTRGEYATAMPYARHLAEMEPWEEDVHAQLMRLLAWQGQRTAALRHYEAVRVVLDQELGIEPSAELEALRRQIEHAGGDRPHNLPTSTSAFVGRGEELAQVTTHLARADRRLITIVGSGGMGKTRLALEAARRVAADHLGPFLDGVYFVSLVGVDTAEQVPTAVADELGITLSGRGTPGREVASWLRQRELLLVLDNLEHLLQDDRLIDWLELLLRMAPAINILVTSRVALNIGAEWTVDLNGLGYPASAENPAIETMLQFDAVALFVQRVQQVNTTFALSHATTPCTVNICRLVNGIPLAIELAAGWIKLLSCNEIAAEIGRNVDILASNRRDLPARHRSMRAVFDYSWVLLSADEQRALMALSVFRGSFDRQAATAVTDISLFTLDELLNKSWLRVANASETDAAVGRYLMLEPLRQYAAEQLRLAVDGYDLQVRDRHATHYLTVAAGQESALRGADQSEALAAIRTENDNLRAAWLWAAERGHSDLLNRALDVIFDYHDMRSTFRDGQQLLQFAFDTVQESATELACRLEARLGWLMFHLGEPDAATTHLQHALAGARALSLQREIAFDLNYLGAIARHQGDVEQATGYLDEALTVAQSAEDQFSASIALNNLSQTAMLRGDLNAAQQLAADSLALKAAVGDRRGSAYSHFYLAQIDAMLGRYHAALDQFAMALAIYADLDDRRGMALVQRNLGDANVHAGEIAAAKVAYLEAVRLFEAIGFVAEADQCRTQIDQLATE
jgi:predicted ATPase/DNA-binding SARP family transcriptional activator